MWGVVRSASGRRSHVIMSHAYVVIMVGYYFKSTTQMVLQQQHQIPCILPFVFREATDASV